MQQLTGSDARFLYMETGPSSSQVNGLSIYQRPDDPNWNAYESLRWQVAMRLPMLPPFRRRLVEVPFGLDHPYWVNDPDFDLDHHIGHVAVSPPGDMAQLCGLMSRLVAQPLDRAHPL